MKALSRARHGAKMAGVVATTGAFFPFLFIFPPAKRLKMHLRGHQRAQYVALYYFNKVLLSEILKMWQNVASDSNCKWKWRLRNCEKMSIKTAAVFEWDNRRF